jgi:hypothetical protein
MGYGVTVILHGAMGYVAMILHGAEKCNKVTVLCDYDALACGAMEYNHGAMRLSVVQKG